MAGESSEKPEPSQRPGQTVETILEQLDPSERLPFLAVVEQKALRSGDLEMLRGLRDYRKMLGLAA